MGTHRHKYDRDEQTAEDATKYTSWGGLAKSTIRDITDLCEQGDTDTMNYQADSMNTRLKA